MASSGRDNKTFYKSHFLKRRPPLIKVGFLFIMRKELTKDQIRFDKFNEEWDKQFPYFRNFKHTEEMKKYQLIVDRMKRIKGLKIKDSLFLSNFVKNSTPIEAVDFQKVIKFIKNNPTIITDIDFFIEYINALIEKHEAYNPNTTLNHLR